MTTICDALYGHRFENPDGDVIYKVHIYCLYSAQTDVVDYTFDSFEDLIRSTSIFFGNFAAITTRVHPYVNSNNEVDLVVDIYVRVRD